MSSENSLRELHLSISKSNFTDAIASMLYGFGVMHHDDEIVEINLKKTLLPELIPLKVKIRKVKDLTKKQKKERKKIPKED